MPGFPALFLLLVFLQGKRRHLPWWGVRGGTQNSWWLPMIRPPGMKGRKPLEQMSPSQHIMSVFNTSVLPGPTVSANQAPWVLPEEVRTQLTWCSELSLSDISLVFTPSRTHHAWAAPGSPDPLCRFAEHWHVIALFPGLLPPLFSYLLNSILQKALIFLLIFHVPPLHFHEANSALKGMVT